MSAEGHATVTRRAPRRAFANAVVATGVAGVVASYLSSASPARAESWEEGRDAIWGAQRSPAPGPPRVYGTTTCGCLAGAVALPARGRGFVQRRPRRPTHFGHPDLIDYVRRLGADARRAGLGALVIGDLSLPRGGVYARGHWSHQTGLDVDIAYRTSADPLAERAGPHAAGVANHAPPANAPSYAPPYLETLLRLAAADPRVDRIFVSPGIKHLMCGAAGDDPAFLAVLRPWWGHDDHFHVRLKCPAHGAECRPNPPVTAIADDCASLSWWKGPEKDAERERWRAEKRAAYERELPDACQSLPAPGPAVISRTARAPWPDRRSSPASPPNGTFVQEPAPRESERGAGR
jgi:penicillin-insensitive murein endopeptidase